MARAGSPKVNGASSDTGGTKPLDQVRPPSCEVEKPLSRTRVKASPNPGKNWTVVPADELYPTTTCFPSRTAEVSLWVENSNGRVTTTAGSKVTMWSSAGSLTWTFTASSSPAPVPRLSVPTAGAPRTGTSPERTALTSLCAISPPLERGAVAPLTAELLEPGQDPVDAVAGVTEHPLDVPSAQPLHQVLADRLGHRDVSPERRYASQLRAAGHTPSRRLPNGRAGGWIPPVPALERRRDLRRSVAPRDEDLSPLTAPGT